MKNRLVPYTLSLLFFTSLGFGRFSINVGFSLKPYMLVSLTILIYLIIHRQFSMPKFSLYEYIAGLFLLFVAISPIFSLYPWQSLRYTANALLLLGIYLVLKIFFTSMISLRVIEKSMIWSSLIIGLANLGYYVIGVLQTGFNFHGNNIISYGLLLDRNSPRLIGTATIDPNITAVYLSIFLFFSLLQKRKYFLKLLFTTAILLTVSRGAYFAVIAALFCFMLATRVKIFKKTLVVKLIIALILGAGTLAIINHLLHLNVLDIAVSRFGQASSDNGSGRLELWAHALDAFKHSPMFGIGANASLSYNTALFNDAHYAHNTFLEVLSELGIIGMFFYLCSLILAIKAAYQSAKLGLALPFLLILGVLFQMVFLSLMTSEISMVVILLLCIYRNVFRENSVKQDEPKEHPKETNKYKKRLAAV